MRIADMRIPEACEIGEREEIQCYQVLQAISPVVHFPKIFPVDFIFLEVCIDDAGILNLRMPDPRFTSAWCYQVLNIRVARPSFFKEICRLYVIHEKHIIVEQHKRL